MKRLYFKSFIIILLILILQLPIVGCSDNKSNNENLFENYYSDSDSNLEIHKAETKPYYAEQQYVTFSISSDFAVYFNGDDIIMFDDQTTMAKIYSYIKISPVDQNYIKSNNGVLVNLKTGAAISKLSTGDKTLKLEEIDLDNFKIVNAMQITPIIEDIETNGVCVFCPIDQENELDFYSIKITKDGNRLTCQDGIIFYTFLNDDASIYKLSQNSFSSNINFNYTLNTDIDVFSIDIKFDWEFDADYYAVMAIIKNQDGDFYYVKMNCFNNKYFKLENLSNTLIDFRLQK